MSPALGRPARDRHSVDTPCRFDQSKAVRWKVWGRLWRQTFGTRPKRRHSATRTVPILLPVVQWDH